MYKPFVRTVVGEKLTTIVSAVRSLEIVNIGAKMQHFVINTTLIGRRARSEISPLSTSHLVFKWPV